MPDMSKHGAAASAIEPKGTLETAKETAKGMVEAVGDFAGQAKDKASGALSQVADQASDLASSAADKVQSYGKDLTELIRRYPVPALLIGVGVGFLLARLTRRLNA